MTEKKKRKPIEKVFYAVFTKKGNSVRTTQKFPAMSANERAVKVRVKLDPAVFDVPTPVVNIGITDEHAIKPEVEAEVLPEGTFDDRG